MRDRFYTLPRRGLDWLRARAELAVLAGIGIGAAALLGFMLIMNAVVAGHTHAFDEALLRALRTPDNPSDPIGPWWVELMFQDITALGGTTVLTLITVTVAGYLAIDR